MYPVAPGFMPEEGAHLSQEGETRLTLLPEGGGWGWYFCRFGGLGAVTRGRVLPGAL